jgi:ABC-2 type transport system permease protein
VRKYLHIFQITLQEYFTYRLNFFLWRFRSLVFTLTLLFFWLAVYGSQKTLFGYEKSQMLTYLLGVVFLDSLILASRTADLAAELRSGGLSKLLLRPVGFFKFFLVRDLGDKALNMIFALIEIAAIVLLLNFTFYFPQAFSQWVLFILQVIISFFLYFFLSLVISLSAFWTEEIWATRWLLGVVLLDFFSGVIFPIDILPPVIAKVFYFTPFPYLVFSPLKIWLGQMTISAALESILITFLWGIAFYYLCMFLWQRGTRKYGAFGG